MNSSLQIGQPQPGPCLFLRSVQLFLCVVVSLFEVKLACAMLTISDEAEGLLNRIFQHAFVFIFHELPMRCELTVWSCAIYAPQLG